MLCSHINQLISYPPISGALQAGVAAPVPGLGVVPPGQEPRPRRRLGRRDNRAVQRCVVPRHLDGADGARRQELQQGKGHLKVGRHRTGQWLNRIIMHNLKNMVGQEIL